MANYRINAGYGDAQNVDNIESVTHKDGFFFFKDEKGELAYVANAQSVRHIKRMDA